MVTKKDVRCSPGAGMVSGEAGYNVGILYCAGCRTSPRSSGMGREVQGGELAKCKSCPHRDGGCRKGLR